MIGQALFDYIYYLFNFFELSDLDHRFNSNICIHNDTISYKYYMIMNNVSLLICMSEQERQSLIYSELRLTLST